MSNRSKWIAIAVVVLGSTLALWAGRGVLWRWLLALHGQGGGHH
jgi:hypothetical protein